MDFRLSKRGSFADANADCEFDTLVNWLQRWVPQVIHRNPHIWHIRFQLIVEYQLVLIVRMQMHSLQFDAIVNWLEI